MWPSARNNGFWVKVRGADTVVRIRREHLGRQIGFEPCPALVRCVAVIERRKERPAVRTGVQRVRRIIFPEWRADEEVKARKALRNEGPELLLRKRGPTEYVHLPKKGDIRNALIRLA